MRSSAGSSAPSAYAKRKPKHESSPPPHSCSLNSSRSSPHSFPIRKLSRSRNSSPQASLSAPYSCPPASTLQPLPRQTAQSAPHKRQPPLQIATRAEFPSSLPLFSIPHIHSKPPQPTSAPAIPPEPFQIRSSQQLPQEQTRNILHRIFIILHIALLMSRN